jgi:hypothetical protein
VSARAQRLIVDTRDWLIDTPGGVVEYGGSIAIESGVLLLLKGNLELQRAYSPGAWLSLRPKLTGNEKQQP